MKTEESERQEVTNNFNTCDNSEDSDPRGGQALQFPEVCEDSEGHEEIELQVSHDIWEKMYKHVKHELEENTKEIQILKEKLAEMNYLLNTEKGRVRHLNAINKRLERDIDEISFDQEELHRDSIMSRQLLASKDKEIESLVAQINLLIQVGTMRRSDTSRSRRASELDTDRIAQRMHATTIESQNSSSSSETSVKDEGVIKTVASLFSTKRNSEELGDRRSQPKAEKNSSQGFQWPSLRNFTRIYDASLNT